MIQQVRKANYSGTIHVPPSKSDTQRALLLAALAKGKSLLRNVGNSADEQAMLRAIELLGAKITRLNERDFEISGITQQPEISAVSLGESGLGSRLMAPVLALFDREITLNGEGSLLQRPMDFFENILPQLGAKVNSNKGFLPLTIRGPIRGREISIDGSLSSQFLSGLLIALSLAEGNSRIHVQNLTSIPYVDMTLDTLERFGIEILNHRYECFEIKGDQLPEACSYTMEGDWSSASCWLAASALGQDISVNGLRFDSLQADRLILEIFRDAHCKIIQKDGNIKVDGSERKAFEADLTHAPDLFPALAVFASLTPGKSILLGTSRLTHKESDRAQAIATEFTKLGCQIRLHENEMHIEGVQQITGNRVDAHHDHRMAMSLAMMGLFSENPVEISGAESVAKSYPSFWEDLSSLEG